jgi:DnaK suppressor protein
MTTTHHSDTFIAEMKQRLEAERDQLHSRLGAHAHLEHGDYVANAPEYERNHEENAMESADHVAIEGITEAEEARLKEVKAALARIEAGTYGMTAKGEMIPEGRLLANPAATTLVSSL